MTHRDRAGEPPEGVGKPCRCPASPAASLLPGGSPARSLWVIINAPWYKKRSSGHVAGSAALPRTADATGRGPPGSVVTQSRQSPHSAIPQVGTENRESPASSAATAVRPTTIRAKYSADQNSFVTSETRGAKPSIRTAPMVPPENEAMAATAPGLPGPPTSGSWATCTPNPNGKPCTSATAGSTSTVPATTS